MSTVSDSIYYLTTHAHSYSLTYREFSYPDHHFWRQVVTAVRNITEVQISRKSIPVHIKGLKISTIDEELFKSIQKVGASIEELIDFEQSKRQKTVVLNSESSELARVRRILLMEARIPSIILHGQMDIDLLYAELGLKLKHMREIGFYLEKKFDGNMTDYDVQERFHIKSKSFNLRALTKFYLPRDLDLWLPPC